MVVSNFDCGSYPILLNPTFQEVSDFNELWDTLRICVDRKNIAIGSGHGNTHHSITNIMVSRQMSTGLPDTYIIFREGDKYYFNLEDVGGKRKASIDKTLREWFTEEQGELLKTLIHFREERRLA